MMDRSREISAGMLDEDPVFIAGMPRTGTTLLRRTLARHPSFAATDTRGPETFVFARPDRLASLLEPAGERLFHYLLDDEAAARAILDHIAAIPPDDGFAPRIRIYFHFAKQARGVRRLLEKTPSHVHHLDEMKRTFPRAKFLLCVRHPVEIYASMRKRHQKASGRGETAGAKMRWMIQSPEQFGRSFEEWVELIERGVRDLGDDAISIGYSELTDRPRALLPRICAFLDEPYEDSWFFDDVDVKRDELGSPIPSGRIVPNPSSWRDYVDEEEAAAIERQVADSMRRLGFARVTN